MVKAEKADPFTGAPQTIDQSTTYGAALRQLALMRSALVSG